MRRKRRLLNVLSLAALAGCAGVTKEPDFPTPARHVSVEQLAHYLRSEGFNWDLLGLKTTFNARVTVPGATPQVLIGELENESVGHAHLYNLPTNTG